MVFSQYKNVSTVNEIVTELLHKNGGLHCVIATTSSEISFICRRGTCEKYITPQVIVLSKNEQNKAEFIKQIKQELSRWFNPGAIFGIGGVNQNCINFSLSCNEAIFAWNCTMLLRKGMVFWEELPATGMIHSIESELCTAVSMGHESKVEALYEKWLEKSFCREHRCIEQLSIDMLMLLSKCNVIDGINEYVKLINPKNCILSQSERTLSLLKDKACSMSVKNYSLPVRIAIKFVKENYTMPISLADAAYVAGVSQNYFSHTFAVATGEPFVSYLTRARLIHAQKLLLDGSDLKIADVAVACGFQDIKYFSKLFKRYVGVPPGKYRVNYNVNDIKMMSIN